MKKNKTQMPLMEEYQDNDFNKSNRQLSTQLGSWINDNYSTLGTVNEDRQREYQDIADQSMGSAWNDFDRQATKAQNVLNAKSYNQFGSLGSTPALYNQETLDRGLNQQAADLSYQSAKAYEDLINSDIARQIANWQYNTGLYNAAGADINDVDTLNWQIRNQNLDRSYINDLQKFQNKIAPWQTLGNMMQSGVSSYLSGMGGGDSNAGLGQLLGNFGKTQSANSAASKVDPSTLSRGLHLGK